MWLFGCGAAWLCCFCSTLTLLQLSSFSFGHLFLRFLSSSCRRWIFFPGAIRLRGCSGVSMRDGRHDEECPSQNQPWLSFALFILDYIIKVMPASPGRLDSLSLFTFRKQVIQHGVSSFLPPPSSSFLTRGYPSRVSLRCSDG